MVYTWHHLLDTGEHESRKMYQFIHMNNDFNVQNDRVISQALYTIIKIKEKKQIIWSVLYNRIK